MRRLALSLFVAAACAGGFANTSSASDWTTYVWAGGDVYKSIGDRITNINGGEGALTSSFGLVAGINTSVGLGNSGIRFQAGASYGEYDFKGRLHIVPDAFAPEKQVFFTTGLTRQGDMQDPFSWGLVYDGFHAERWGVNANEIDLGQVRGIFGVALNGQTEVGVWGTYKTNTDKAAVTVAGAPGLLSTIRAINQANFYVKRDFAFGAEVTGYAGLLDKKSIGDWQFGLLGQAPLSPSLSMYGNFNYVVPSAPKGPVGSGREQFDVSFGLAYKFGGKAQTPTANGLGAQPLLNVANNGSFLVTTN